MATSDARSGELSLPSEWAVSYRRGMLALCSRHGSGSQRDARWNGRVAAVLAFVVVGIGAPAAFAQAANDPTVRRGPGRVVQPQENARVANPWQDRFGRSSRGQQLLPSQDQIARAVVPEFVTSALETLRDGSWAEREAATVELEKRELPLAVLMKVLDRNDLDLEVRNRLIRVACDRVENAPRGALGIRMNLNGDGRPGVVVDGLIAGLPGIDHLEISDRILAIDGEPVDNSAALRGVIGLREAGDEVELTVKRLLRDDRGQVVIDEQGIPRERDVTVRFALGPARLLEDDTVGARNVLGRERLGAIAEIRARYAPTPLFVTVEADPARDLRFVGLAPESDGRLRELVRRLESPGFEVDVVRERVKGDAVRTLREIVQEAADPARGEHERAFLRRVAEAYRRLMPADW